MTAQPVQAIRAGPAVTCQVRQKCGTHRAILKKDFRAVREVAALGSAAR